MKVAITGASGFIGRALVKSLSNEVEIIALGRTGGRILSFPKNEFVNYQECNYTEKELDDFCQGVDSIINLASQKVVPGEKDGLLNYISSLELLENVLKTAKKNNIKNVINISSRCVYGETNQVPYNEDARVDPINLYGVAKLMGEELCNYYNKKMGLCVKSLRLAQVVGYPMNDGYMFSTFLKQVSKGEDVNIWGYGKGKRDYIYIKDVVAAIRCALIAKEEKGVFNIGSGIGISNFEIAKLMKEKFQSTSEIHLLTDREEDASVTYLDTEKAEKRLHFKCAYSMADTIEDIVNMMKIV